MASAGYAQTRRSSEPFGGARALALLAIAVTLIGFWRTFFTQLGNTDTLHMLHGASSVGWLVLVLVQASLIRARKFNAHRLLGCCSLLLFTLLLVSAWNVLVLMPPYCVTSAQMEKICGVLEKSIRKWARIG